MAKAKQSRDEGISYEEILPTLEKYMKDYEAFHYAHMKRAERSEQGTHDAWTAAKIGFRKVGLEGVLESLDAQVESAMKAGDGLAGTLTASKALAENERIYTGCALALKVKDLVPYIQERLKDVPLVIKDEYQEMTLAQLVHEKAGKEKKAYGTYLMEQLDNAVGVKVSGAVYLENAKRMNEAYNPENQVKIIKLPNEAYIRHKKAA